ncbi:hypothetical protein [Roseivivax sp. CAU 1761]
MSDKIEVTGYGRDEASARQDAQWKMKAALGDRQSDRDMDQFSGMAMGLTAMVLSGYLILIGVLLGQFLYRPIPAILTACAFFIPVAAIIGSAAQGSSVGDFVLLCVVFASLSWLAARIAGKLDRWFERFEDAEALALSKLPFAIRSPVMLTILFSPTIIAIVAAWQEWSAPHFTGQPGWS